MKKLFVAALLGFFSLPAVAAEDQTRLDELTKSALGDIKHVVMYHEHVRNPDWVLVNEGSYDCSLEEAVLSCAGWYGVYYQNPLTAGVEPSWGHYTLKFSVLGNTIAAIIDESFEPLFSNQP